MASEHRFINKLENGIEKFLWGFRIIIILGVFGLLTSSIVIFLVGAIETIALLKLFVIQLSENGIHFSLAAYNTIIVHIISTIDDFLLGMVLLIFGLGTYDLFISKLDIAEDRSKNNNIRRPDWLRIGSLDELKSILGKIVLMILIINFLRFVVECNFEQPLHLLYLAGGIALVALAILLSHGKDIEQTKITKKRLAAFKLSKKNRDKDDQ